MNATGYILCIDFGTTAVKAAVVQATQQLAASEDVLAGHATVLGSAGSSVEVAHAAADTVAAESTAPDLSIISSSSVVTDAYVDEMKPGHREQSVAKILGALNTALQRLAESGNLHLCRSIAISDQMHGVVRVCAVKDDHGNELLEWSNLITWEDQRSTCELLAKLNTAAKAANLPPLFSGYGCASLASTAADVCAPVHWTHAGTIGSVIASLLAGLPYSVMDPTDAASWGLFDVAKQAFRLDIAEAAGILIPREGFPAKIVPSGVPLGHVTAAAARSLHLPALESLIHHASSGGERMLVHSSVGDHQAAVAGALFFLQKSTALSTGYTLVLSMGTSIQATAVPHDDDARQAVLQAKYEDLPPGCEVRPSVNGSHFFTAASMNGGNVLSWMASKAQTWLHERARGAGGSSVSKDDAYEWLEKSAAEILGKHPIRVDSEHRASVNGLSLAPTLVPERVPVYSTSSAGEGAARRGEEKMPDFPPESFGAAYAALAAGVLCNVCSMLPAQCWARATGVVVAGGGFQKSQIINFSLKHVLPHFGVDIPITALSEEQLGNAGNIGIAWNALRYQRDLEMKEG